MFQWLSTWAYIYFIIFTGEQFSVQTEMYMELFSEDIEN